MICFFGDDTIRVYFDESFNCFTARVRRENGEIFETYGDSPDEAVFRMRMFMLNGGL